MWGGQLKNFARFARITSITPHYFDTSVHALITINVATEIDTLETFCGLAVMM